MTIYYYFVSFDTISTLEGNTNIPRQSDSLLCYLMISLSRKRLIYMTESNINRSLTESKVDSRLMKDGKMSHSGEKS